MALCRNIATNTNGCFLGRNPLFLLHAALRHVTSIFSSRTI